MIIKFFDAKYFLTIVYLLIISGTCATGKAGSVPISPDAIRGSFFLGAIRTQSEDPGLLFATSEGASTSQTGLGFDYLHSFKSLKLGVGIGRSARADWKDPYYKYSTNVHALVEIGDNTKSRVFFFDISPGIMQGSQSNAYYPYIEVGPVFNLNKDAQHLNIFFRPSILYQGVESKNKIEYDCRYTPPGKPCDGTPYTLHFHTFIFNASLILQCSLFRRDKRQY